MFLFGLMVVLGLHPQCQAAKILLAASPRVWNSDETVTSQIKCTLTDTGDDQVDSISSIIIYRSVEGVNDRIAGITSPNSIQFVPEENIRSVDGDVTHGGPHGFGYLQVNWERPGLEESGLYVCEIQAVNASGEQRTFQTSVAISFGPDGQENLEKTLLTIPAFTLLKNKLEALISEEQATVKIPAFTLLKEKVEALGNITGAGGDESLGDVLRGLTDSVCDIEDSVCELEEGFATLNESASDLGDVRREMDDFRAELAQLKEQSLSSEAGAFHTETGEVSCGTSDNYPDQSNNQKIKIMPVTFTTPYKNPPSVITSYSYLDVDRAENTRVRDTITDITTTGFNIECVTWARTKLWGLNIRWMSVGH